MSFIIPDHVTWKNLEKGIVLLDLNSSNYYTLNETASDIWRAILGGSDEVEIVADLQSKYNCHEDQCLADVKEQLAFLKQEKLLEEKN